MGNLQSGTQGDTVLISLFQDDGVTPFVPGGYQTASIAVTYQDGTETDFTPLSVASNVMTIKTSTNMFVKGGYYRIEPIFTYADGTITKAAVFQIKVEQSLR